MRTTGSPQVLEYRRRLAIERIQEGYSARAVADFLGVDPSSVRRWLAAFRRHGGDALAARPVPGRPPKLTGTQEKVVRRWLDDKPTEHGFATELWTGSRRAQLIEQEWGIHFHPNYLESWLRRRGFTPQKPQRVARERDDEAVARWLETDWPRIKKRRGGGGRRSCCSTRAGR
jgi:transposase